MLATEMPGAAEPWTFYSQGETGAGEQEAEALAALAPMDRLPPDVPMAISTPNMSMAVALMGHTADNRSRTPGLARLMERVSAGKSLTDWCRMGQAAEMEARARGERRAAEWYHHTFPPPTPPQSQVVELDPDTPIGEGLDFGDDPPLVNTPSTVGTAEPGAEQDFEGIMERVEVSSATNMGSESERRDRKKPRRLIWEGMKDPESG